MKTLLLLALVSITSVSQAKNYYISTSGSNSNTGLTPATAWQSIAQVNSSFNTFLAGDSILFKSGETFYGTLTVTKAGTSAKPIVIGSYSTGAKPVITGFTTLSSWTNEGNGIYSKIITSTAQTMMVTIDGIQVAMGRYPDKDFLSYETCSANVSITDNTLGATTNWAGAEAVIKKNDWTVDRCLITTHSNNTLTYSIKPAGSYCSPGSAGFGYFIQNDLRTLTTYGEWYHNTTTGKFYMYFGSVAPTTKVVKVATLNNLFTDANQDYIVVNNIGFSGSIDNTVSFTGGTDYCTVQNCTISFGGRTGLVFSAGTTAVANNNVVTNCNRTGISTDGTASTITNNTVSYIGTIIGQALSVGGYEGIYSPGNAVVIKYNTIHNTGYNGISLRYTGTATIQYNVIDSSCSTLDDGAGIYTSSPNASVRLIDHNMIFNMVGNSAGTPSNTSLTAGIYLDESSTNVTVSNNTIANNPFSAIKLHKAHENKIIGNTTFNNAYGMDFLNSAGTNIRNVTLKGNIFFSKAANQYSLRFYSVANDISSFGLADSNYYPRPINDSLVFNLNQPSTGQMYKTLTGLQAFTSQDTHSKKSPKSVTDVNTLRFEYNASNSPKVITFSGQTKIDSKGVVYTNTASIPAWSSIILIDNGVAINKSPVLNAGVDNTITLPVNTITLTGTATDSDGTIGSYAWTKISGPAAGTITTATTATTTLTGLVQGVYKFELKVTDNSGAITKDTVQVTVNAARNVAPVANAGTDKTIQLPTNILALTGKATDTDGTINTYSWSKISGPTSGTITTAAAATTTLTALVQGVYQFELKVTDNSGAIAKDTVRVTVNAAPNQAPVANAGNDMAITLPNNETTLTGTATDLEGGKLNYVWVKISGPAAGIIATQNASTTELNTLEEGVYEYELTVTDNGGAKAKDTVQVTVAAAIPAPAPVANAGANIEINLPANSATLNGTATDMFGTVVSYSWSKISGPSSGKIAMTDSASTLINKLVNGVYQFGLTVTDNNGFVAMDTVQVTVNKALRQAPIARAGANKTITLPINTTTLSAVSTVSENPIQTINWSKISGPAAGNIEVAKAISTSLNGLVEGVYKIELTVTDINGTTGKDTIEVTVNAAAMTQFPLISADAEVKNTLRVYPNPVRDVTNLNITSIPGKDKILISVVNMSGIVVKTGEVANQEKVKNFKLNMSGLSDGNYIILVKFANGQVISSKVIKYGGE